MKCPVCNKPIEREMVPFSDPGTCLGEFEAEVCHQDSEVFFTEKAAIQIEEAEKEAGIRGSEIPLKTGKGSNTRKVKT